MNLTEIYINIFLENFFQGLQEEISLNEEIDPNLKKLLDEANTSVFEKFKITPQDKVYFIAGSATLYLYPELRNEFNLRGTIGDLDIVIPGPEYWENAGLKGQTIYRPEGNSKIEVFTEWDPSKAEQDPSKDEDEYANVKVRDTNTILNNAIQIDGYWFMSLRDTLEYKFALNRPKEKDIVDLINSYKGSSREEKIQLLRDLRKYYKKQDTKKQTTQES